MTDRSYPLALGIDLGGTKILTALIDEQGTIVTRDRRVTPADQGRDAVIEAMVGSAHTVVQQAQSTMDDIGAVGIGVPGPSNPETGVLHAPPNLPGWRDVPIRDLMADRLGKPAHLINDANAAALAEYHFGAGRHARCFIYVTVSTGIGGGVVIDGDIYTGASGLAGEIGHMTIENDGPVCNCGNRGCWEALASGTALAARARRSLSENSRSAILTAADGNLEAVTARHVHEAAKGGDPLAVSLLETTSRYLGTGLANLINLFNPDVIAVGGGMSNMGDMLMAPAYAVAEQRSFADAYSAVRFVSAQLGGDSGVMGAGIHALRREGTK